MSTGPPPFICRAHKNACPCMPSRTGAETLHLRCHLVWRHHKNSALSWKCQHIFVSITGEPVARYSEEATSFPRALMSPFIRPAFCRDSSLPSSLEARWRFYLSINSFLDNTIPRLFCQVILSLKEITEQLKKECELLRGRLLLLMNKMDR